MTIKPFQRFFNHNIELFNVEEDELIKEMCESLNGVRDCSFKFEEVND